MRSTNHFITDQPGSSVTGGRAEPVRMRRIWKRFPGVAANQGIDLDLLPGEVHALLGENGAGKTTLMRILAGFYKQDEGEITMGDQQLNIRSPADAIRYGIGLVHQNFRLVDTLTVAENIHLGWKETPSVVSASSLFARSEAICQKFGMDVDVQAKIWQLSTGEQQRVEILRVLSRGVSVLILDEPTSVLTPHETQDLFRVLRDIAEAGQIVVFISHKLEEVLEVSDRITVLREGRVVGSRMTKDCDLRSLARLMVGDVVVSHSRSRSEQMPGEAVLELVGVHARNDRDLPALKDLNLKVHSGEIVGIAGVAGNGQTELAEVITGLRQVDRGKILVGKSDMTNRTASHFATAGIGHIPEDRLGVGFAENETIISNAILREYKSPPVGRRWFLSKAEAKRFAQGLVATAGVRVLSVEVPIRLLSGGNIQRLLARRETRIASRLLVAVHPTRGLDISATEELLRLLHEHRTRGGSVLFISEDLDELLEVADRIAVMYEGRIKGEFESSAADRETIGLLMGGANSIGGSAS